MKIKLKIAKHEDRMKVIEALQANGYNATIQTATEYMPTRIYVVVDLERSDRV